VDLWLVGRLRYAKERTEKRSLAERKAVKIVVGELIDSLSANERYFTE
jgi:hypothetical protein